jgi:hypothetical protein
MNATDPFGILGAEPLPAFRSATRIGDDGVIKINEIDSLSVGYRSIPLSPLPLPKS